MLYIIKHHLFADDEQAPHCMMSMTCVIVYTDISNWCASRRLQLNDNKTALAWFGKRSHLAQLANTEPTVTIGASVIQQSTAVADPGCLKGEAD